MPSPGLPPALAAVIANTPQIVRDHVEMTPLDPHITTPEILAKEQGMTNTLRSQMPGSDTRTLNAPLPSPEAQEQMARDLPSKVFHGIGQGFAALQWARSPVDASLGSWMEALDMLEKPLNGFLDHVFGDTPAGQAAGQAASRIAEQQLLPPMIRALRTSGSSPEAQQAYQQELANPANTNDFTARWNAARARYTVDAHNTFGENTLGRFAWDTVTDPLSYLGWGMGENAGREIIAGAAKNPQAIRLAKEAVGRALIIADRAPNAPFIAAKKSTQAAYDFAKTKPLFEPAFNALDKTFGHGTVDPETGQLVGGSLRAALENHSRNVQDILETLKERGLNLTGFNDSSNLNPLSLSGDNAFTGYTPDSRKLWNSMWDDLRKQVTQLADPVSKVYGLDALQSARQAVARKSADASSLETLIDKADPETLRNWGLIDRATGTPTGRDANQVKQELYNDLHNYTLGAGSAVKKMLGHLTPDEAALAKFTPEQSKAVSGIMDQLNGLVQGETGVARTQSEGLKTTANDIKAKVRSAQDALTIIDKHGGPQTPQQQKLYDLYKRTIDHTSDPTRDLTDISREAVYNHRNSNISALFDQARQAMADHLTSGSVDDLNKLIGIHDPMNNKVASDFFRDFNSARAQALGNGEVGHLLPDKLSGFYNSQLAHSLPQAVSQVANDRGRLGMALQPKARELLSWSGYTPPQVDALIAKGTGIDQALHDSPKRIRTLTQLVKELQNKNVLEPTQWHTLNQLNNAYRRGGDLLFDNDMKMVAHKLVNQKAMELGPTNKYQQFVGDALHYPKLAAQSFKELLLLSPAYHPLVTGQELVTGALHGFNPMNVAKDLSHAYKKGFQDEFQGDSDLSILPRTYQHALDLQGRSAPAALTGLGSTAITGRAARGGADEAITATEQIPAWLRMLMGGALGFQASGGTLDPLTIGAGAFGGLIAPKLVRWNTGTSRNVETVLRAGPWHQKSQEYLNSVAPEFLDRMEAALAADSRLRLPTKPNFQQGFRVNPTHPPAPPVLTDWEHAVPGVRAEEGVPTGPPPGPIDPELNPLQLPESGANAPSYTTPALPFTEHPDAAAIRDTINRLRGRNGNFSAEDIATLPSMFGAHDDIARNFSKEWLNHLNESDTRGLAYANHIHSDYGITSNYENWLSKVGPFYVWMNRLIPFYLRHGLENPSLAYNFVRSQKMTENANRDENRLSPRYNQMVKIPGLDWLANATTGQQGSSMMMNPLSPFVPGMGIGKLLGGSSEPAGNAALGAAGGLGFETYPTIPFLLNALSALHPGGMPDFYQEPAPNLFRQDPLLTATHNSIGLPVTQALYDAVGAHNLDFPMAQAQSRSADPEAFFHAIYNSPRTVLGQSSPDYIDIATKRKLAEWSVQFDGRPNSPQFVAAMSNPNSMLYLQAKAEASRQQNAASLTRFVEPFSVRSVSPMESAVESQRSQSQKDFGPILAEITSKYMENRYPLSRTYSMADSGSGELAQQQINPFPMNRQFGVIPQTPMPEFQAYLHFLVNYNIPQDQWFTPQVTSLFLQNRSAMQPMIQQMLGKEPFNPLTNTSSLR